MDKFYIEKDAIFSRELRVYYRMEHGDSGYAYAQPVEFKHIPDDESCIMIMSPMMKISTESAQQLVDLLWDLGFRPSEGSGSAGAMMATQKHLEDMRSLVFKTESKTIKEG